MHYKELHLLEKNIDINRKGRTAGLKNMEGHRRYSSQSQSKESLLEGNLLFNHFVDIFPVINGCVFSAGQFKHCVSNHFIIKL